MSKKIFRAMVFLLTTATFSKPGLLKPVPGKLNEAFRHESTPSVTGDGKKMFYIKLNPNKKGALKREDWDLYVSNFKNGKWLGGRPIRGLNSNKYEGYPSVTASGKEIFFSTNAYSEDGDKDIYTSKFKNGKWSKPKNMGEAINIAGLDEIGGSISPNGNIFVFAARDRDDCLGETDIYISYKIKGKWSLAKNIGRSINSKKSEMAPYIAADGRTLYFSSNKYGGFGKQDIYKSLLYRGKWTRSINLGKKINTSGNDIGISIPAAAKTFFTSASIKGSGYDIYSGKLPLRMRPLKVVILKLNVQDKNNKHKLVASVLFEDLDTGKYLQRISYNSQQGFSTINLTEGTTYAVTIQAPGYFVFTDNINLKKQKDFRIEKRMYHLTPIKVGEVAEVKNIFFSVGSSRLSSTSRKALTRVYYLLKNNKNLKLEVQGHTDNVGYAKRNQILSKARAKVVYMFLIKKGIAKHQLSFKGYGDTKPKVKNNSSENKAKNRRIEFLVKER